MNIMAVEADIASTALTAQRPHAEASRSPGVAEASHTDVRQIVENMQIQLESMNISLQYHVYGQHGEKIAVSVVNRETGEVIREIPSKEMQALQAKMSELVGMIFNDNA
jgi:flagellar protein FlaG